MFNLTNLCGFMAYTDAVSGGTGAGPSGITPVLLHHADTLYDVQGRLWGTTYAGIISGGEILTRAYPTGLTDKIYLQHAAFVCPGDYTLECFAEFTDQPSAGAQIGQSILAAPGTGGPVVWLNCEGGGNTVRWYASGGTRTTLISLDEDIQYHIAVCRLGTTTYLWVNGALIDSFTAAVADAIETGELLFGGTQYSGTNYFQIVMDEIRLTKAALYTSPFTPPTIPFPDP